MPFYSMIVEKEDSDGTHVGPEIGSGNTKQDAVNNLAKHLISRGVRLTGVLDIVLEAEQEVA